LPVVVAGVRGFRFAVTRHQPFHDVGEMDGGDVIRGQGIKGIGIRLAFKIP
jgi:hypothetical protein